VKSRHTRELIAHGKGRWSRKTIADVIDYQRRWKAIRYHISMDFLTKAERSKRMSLIRGKNTKLEIKFRKNLWKAGLRGI